MAADVWACVVQGVQEADRVDLGHLLGHLFRGEPCDRGRFLRGALGSARRLAAEDQGDDASGRVLVDPGELVHLDVDARLLQDLAADAGLRGLGEFEDSARQFPSPVVRSADRQESAVLAEHRPGYGHGVQWR